MFCTDGETPHEPTVIAVIACRPVPVIHALWS